MDDTASGAMSRLEAQVERDPGTEGFAALAEALRRAGRLEEAEVIVRRGLAQHPDARDGLLVLGLVLLDRGRADETLVLFGSLMDGALARLGLVDAEADDDLEAAEFEQAFARAETDRDELITPDRVAEEALERADGLGPDPLSSPLEPGSAFATHTMAELLERQGDGHGAQQIRAALGAAATSAPARPEPAAGGAADRDRVVAELERWLDNLQGVRA